MLLLLDLALKTLLVLLPLFLLPENKKEILPIFRKEITNVL